MSIIFQTLQKLSNRTESGQEAEPADAVERQDRPRRLGLRMGLVAAGVAAVVLLGFGSVIGVRYLAGQADQGRDRGRLRPAAVRKIAQSTDERGAITTRAVYTPRTQTPEPKAAYYPPRAEAKPQVFQTRTPEPPRDQKTTPAVPAPPVPNKDTAPAEHDRRQPVGQDTTAKTDRSPFLTLPETAEKRRPETPSTRSAEAEQAATRRRVERQRQIMLARGERISRLVNRLEETMARPNADSGQIDALFSQLQSLKGADDPYVVKMKAYRLLRQGKFQQAEVLLTDILAGDAQDLEAGLNLAIIEMQTNRFQQALARLQQLRQVYPDNAMIADLIRKLRKWLPAKPPIS